MSWMTAPWIKTYQELGLDWSEVADLPELTISDYVREHAQKFGDREALVFMGRAISYGELDSLADRFAWLLRALGCQNGDVLGCHLTNTPQYVVALVGAARLGVVVTCISPLATAREVIAQANDSRIKGLITLEESQAELVPALAGAVPTLKFALITSVTELLDGEPSATSSATLGNVQVLGLSESLQKAQQLTTLPEPVSLDQVLYLIYTGGTTGTPKGAQLSSRNLLITNHQCEPFFQFNVGHEVVTSAFPIFHVGGMTVLLNALCTASTFTLIPNPRDVEHMCAEMKARPPAVIAAVPTLLQMLVTRPHFAALDFSQLRVVISGAGPLPESEVKKLETLIGSGKLTDVYGMTESSGVQTINPQTRFKPGTVGLPAPGTEVRVVDGASFKELPLGQPGEILVSGPQVMSGYVGQPESPATFRQIEGRTWMVTGDIGSFDEEGYLKLVDRSKDMLVVGGFKVFSVEVENQLRALPFIEVCAIVGRDDLARPGNDIVQLFVQRVHGDSVPVAQREQEVVAFCRANLSPFKVPKEIHFLDAMPLTAIGKVDKRALRARSKHL